MWRPPPGGTRASLVSPLLGARLLATDDSLAAPTFVLRSKRQCAAVCWGHPQREHPAWRAQESPASAVRARGTRWPCAVPPFALQHLALRRRVVPTLRLQLKKPIVVSHHAVLADRAFVFQSENPVQFRGPRRATVIVLRLRRPPRKPPVVFRQILPLQVHVGGFLTADLPPPQFLYRSEEHTSELQSHHDLVCRLLLEKKKQNHTIPHQPNQHIIHR